MLARALDKHPFACAWIVAFLAYALVQGRFAWLPAYHDALTNWDAAMALRERPWLPFLFERDTGHPPLMAWLLAVAMRLGVPTLLAMHLLAWASAALLVAAVFALGRRLGGTACGLAAGFFVFCHPVIFGQALQFNLDLPLAAFAWWAVWAAVEGRRHTLAVALCATALAKLNGIASLIPFVVLAAWRLRVSGSLRDAHAWRRELLPLLPAIVLFAAYHLGKLLIAGHLFDSGEFGGGRQVAVVFAPFEIARRVVAGGKLLLAHNGNVWVLAALALWGAVALARRQGLLPATERASDAARAEIVLLGTALLAVHLTVNGLREIMPLMRYYIVCYPALFLPLAALAAQGQREHRATGLTVTVLFVGMAFLMRIHPVAASWMPHAGPTRFANPPAGVPTNGENSAEFVDSLLLLRAVAHELDAKGLPRPTVQAPWPFHAYLYDAAHGIVARPFTPPPDERPGDYIVVSSLSFTAQGPPPPREIGIAEGYAREAVFEQNRAWMMLLRREE
ncbi:MAG: glycosyltransferase family 39 protein [Candidatus Sumerlaeia bacterium]|nr:glycosyltransferase family 39 protein [Candidatus Sumerlaeia bacterium]